jgi:ATP phosphoribosyltransferase-like protein
MDNQTFDRELMKLNIAVEPGEQIFDVIYKHWAHVIWPILSLIVLVILTSFGIIVYLFSGTINGENFLVLTSLVGFWYFALALYGISEWHSYRHSALIITSQRLIDCSQLTFITRRVQTIDIYEVQSCTGEAGGSLGTIFGYGDLMVNTLGDKAVCIKFIPQPETVSNQVMHYHHLSAHGSVAAGIDIHGHTPDPAAVADSKAHNSNDMTVLAFHVPSEDLQNTLKDLPAQREPTLTYLPKTDYYAIDIAVPTYKVPEIVEDIKAKGAVDIIGQEMKSLE